MSSDSPIVAPANLDLGHLALFVGLAYADQVEAELGREHPGLRFSHGFLIQHLVGAERTIGELADRLEVTQQAASKVVGELEGLGYLERTVDPVDARVRRIRLSDRGRAAVEASRRRRKAIEMKLETKHGKQNLARIRASLSAILESLGGAEDVRQRRVRMRR